MKSERLYLADILRSIEKIEKSAEVSRFLILKSLAKQSKKLSVTTRNKRPEVDWKGFMGFRDILIHQYDKVIVEEVWETINNDLPILKHAILYLLENLV
ncbi:MAG: hypothetical protein BWK79_05205 [Beggiatoa sp. IS2]|nr:MAG: hypothetical protein BWK79_05205 [Beggiatoa sp. IS2]